MSNKSDKRIAIGNNRSISDDDLCSNCAHCLYSPGEMSGCSKGWPTTQAPSEYVTECEAFLHVPRGENWV
jgi:hypothetical protein